MGSPWSSGSHRCRCFDNRTGQVRPRDVGEAVHSWLRAENTEVLDPTGTRCSGRVADAVRCQAEGYVQSKPAPPRIASANTADRRCPMARPATGAAAMNSGRCSRACQGCQRRYEQNRSAAKASPRTYQEARLQRCNAISQPMPSTSSSRPSGLAAVASWLPGLDAVYFVLGQVVAGLSGAQPRKSWMASTR